MKTHFPYPRKVLSPASMDGRHNLPGTTSTEARAVDRSPFMFRSFNGNFWQQGKSTSRSLRSWITRRLIVRRPYICGTLLVNLLYSITLSTLLSRGISHTKYPIHIAVESCTHYSSDPPSTRSDMVEANPSRPLARGSSSAGCLNPFGIC